MSPALVAFVAVLGTAVGGAACIGVAGALWRLLAQHRRRLAHETARITSETSG